MYPRILNFQKTTQSMFLFGPRQTGKTSLLKELPWDWYADLLDPTQELELMAHPNLFWEKIEKLKKNALIIVDEIQKVPSLLNYVQMGIDQKKFRFILSGSSSRKLRRGGANLLGGRAIYQRLYPLTAIEIASDFNLSLALQFGTLPRIFTLIQEKKEVDAIRLLKSYVITYLKEEIQAEALVRRLDSFQRFLPVAAQSNAQMIEFANIARECHVHMNTVKDYYQILEDTLIGQFLWPLHRSERKKARPKFYFFDCGVLLALQGRTAQKPHAHEMGFLFETWWVNEITRMNDYFEKEHRFSLWRQGDWEIDLVIEDHRGPILAFECKSGKQISNPNSIRAFSKLYPKIPIILVSMLDKTPYKLDKNVEVLPWKKALEYYEKF